MAEDNKNVSSSGVTIGSCNIKVESIVSVDERGQMVLPKEVRNMLGIRGGDKLAVASCTDIDDKATCLCLIKSDELAGMVKDLLGPMLKEIAS